MTERHLGDEADEIVVADGAVQHYARERDLDPGAARTELREYMRGAVPTRHPRYASVWRYRRRSSGVDVIARVEWRGRVAVVAELLSLRRANIGARGGRAGWRKTWRED